MKETIAGDIYRVGLVLLDLDEPTRVLHRLPRGSSAPLEPYERTGDVPNVVFPCGLVHDEASDEVRLYYGAADSSICLATSRLADLLDAVLAAPADARSSDDRRYSATYSSTIRSTPKRRLDRRPHCSPVQRR